MAGKRGKKKKKGGVLSTIIMLIALVVFGISAYQLYGIVKGYMVGREEYEDIRDLALGNTGKEGDDDGFTVDFDKLLKINEDTVGWIRFHPEPSEIDYPIVQGENNQQYLHTTFSANENTLGAIFLKTENNPNFADRNSVIYGHRMRDGSMFRHLQDYDSKDFWKKNPYFYIYTLQDRLKLTYHIFSAGTVVDTTDTYKTEFATDEEFQAFLDMAKSNSFYDTGVEVGLEDRVVTCSTCTSASDEHRIVVRGVLEKVERMPEKKGEQEKQEKQEK